MCLLPSFVTRGGRRWSGQHGLSRRTYRLAHFKDQSQGGEGQPLALEAGLGDGVRASVPAASIAEIEEDSDGDEPRSRLPSIVSAAPG